MSTIANMGLTTEIDNPVLKAAENAATLFGIESKPNNRFEQFFGSIGISNTENEVNHRPAVQQCAVCTPLIRRTSAFEPLPVAAGSGFLYPTPGIIAVISLAGMLLADAKPIMESVRRVISLLGF